MHYQWIYNTYSIQEITKYHAIYKYYLYELKETILHSELVTRNVAVYLYVFTGSYRQSGGGLNINILRPRQDGRHFADDIFKCIFLNEMYEFCESFTEICS